MVVKGDFESLRKKLSELKVEQADIDELQKAIESEPVIKERAKFGQKVGAWIGKMVQKAATGAWDIRLMQLEDFGAFNTKYYGF